MKKIFRSLYNRISESEFRNALFFVGIVLSIYLITGCLLGTIQESQARSYTVIEVEK